MTKQEALEKLALDIVDATVAGKVSSKSLAEYLYDAGYRLAPELPVLSDEEIMKAARVGYFYLSEYRRVAQAQRDDCLRRIGG